MRIVVADDSLLMREAIEHIFQGEDEIEIAAVCEDRDSLDAAIERERPDVVVTDIRMPPAEAAAGIEVANRLRESHPKMGVVILSQYTEVQYVLALLESGSERRGYLLKQRLADRAQLVSAVRTVASGGSVIDSALVDALVASNVSKAQSRLDRLTTRERQILAEVASGKSNGAIARSLVISKRAVETHVSSIFQKLDLPDESEVSRRVKAVLLFLAETDLHAGDVVQGDV
jgi:DNA-binding NarL/FixJ family response regulator